MRSRREGKGRTTVEGRGAEFNNEFRNSMRRLRRDRSTPVHARTNVRRRVPNNRLPLSLGMLRTATSLQIVPTLRVLLLFPSSPSQPYFPAQPLSRNFPGVLPRRPPAYWTGTDPTFTYSRRIQLPFARASYDSRESAARERSQALANYVWEYRSTVNLSVVSLIIVRHSQSTPQLIRLFYYILHPINISRLPILLRFFSLELRACKETSIIYTYM